MSLVEIKVFEDSFWAIVLGTTGDTDYLRIGELVVLLFKETEVSIGKNLNGLISLRNRFKSKIKEIRGGKLLSSLTLDYHGIDVGSVISTRSTTTMDLKIGETVEWLVKTNEITLSKVNR